MIHLMIMMDYDSVIVHNATTTHLQVAVSLLLNDFENKMKANNKQQPNHSPSFNQTNHSSDNDSVNI